MYDMSVLLMLLVVVALLFCYCSHIYSSPYSTMVTGFNNPGEDEHLTKQVKLNSTLNRSKSWAYSL